MFEAFAIFCGIGIHNTKMYEGAVKMMAKQKVALDCLSYHASAAIDDTEELAKAAIPTANTYSLHRYEYILNTVFVFVLRKRKTKVIHIQSANTKSQGKLQGVPTSLEYA